MDRPFGLFFAVYVRLGTTIITGHRYQSVPPRWRFIRTQLGGGGERDCRNGGRDRRCITLDGRQEQGQDARKVTTAKQRGNPRRCRRARSWQELCGAPPIA
jgi:hypothetical protein